MYVGNDAEDDTLQNVWVAQTGRVSVCLSVTSNDVVPRLERGLSPVSVGAFTRISCFILQVLPKRLENNVPRSCVIFKLCWLVSTLCFPLHRMHWALECDFQLPPPVPHPLPPNRRASRQPASQGKARVFWFLPSVNLFLPIRWRFANFRINLGSWSATVTKPGCTYCATNRKLTNDGRPSVLMFHCKPAALSSVRATKLLFLIKPSAVYWLTKLYFL